MNEERYIIVRRGKVCFTHQRFSKGEIWVMPILCKISARRDNLTPAPPPRPRTLGQELARRVVGLDGTGRRLRVRSLLRGGFDLTLHVPGHAPAAALSMLRSTFAEALDFVFHEGQLVAGAGVE